MSRDITVWRWGNQRRGRPASISLEPEEQPRAEFISDLAGYDLVAHNGSAQSVISPVLAWLLTRPSIGPTPPLNPTVIGALLPSFVSLVEAEELHWGHHLPWPMLVRVARDLVAGRLI